MAREPFKIRLTADGAGTLDAVKVRVELVDRFVVDVPPEPEPEP